MPQDRDFQEQIGRVEGLVHAIDAWPDPAARAAAEELVQGILALHGAGLERMLDLAWEAGPAGQALVDAFAQDARVGPLLLLHGLHPVDLETRVTQALDKVRPYLGSHGGNVELLSVDDGQVRLRLQGSCNGCPSSEMTLKLAIEEAIQEFAPDIAGLAVEGVVARPPPPAGFVPLTLVAGPARPAAPNGGRWTKAGDLSALPPGAARVVEVDGVAVCFCQLAGTFYAYGDTCPACDGRLAGARLEGTALVCPACGYRYDLMRAGRCLDQPNLHLEPFPLLVERGQVKVALPAAVAR